MYKMLIVDDEAGNLNVLKLLFQDDYRVVFANNGNKALDELFKPENNDIAIIISDKRMPKVSGIQFLQESKKRFPDVIRVLITGYPDKDDLEVLINDIGVDLFYAKPLTDTKLKELKVRIEKALGKFEVNKVKDYLYKEFQEKHNQKSN